MDPKTQNLIVGLVIGVLATLLISNYSVNNQNYGMMRMMGMGRGIEHMMEDEDHGDDNMMSAMHGDEGMNTNDMVEKLENLTGDEFDQAFVKLMIEHHQGAIDMAHLISARSQREDLRKMGEDIINVQSTEIDMMNGWLNEWFN